MGGWGDSLGGLCAGPTHSSSLHFTPTPTGECYAELVSKWRSPSLYEATCDLRCEEYDYTHFTFIFTAFVMCQLFNECVGALSACLCAHARTSATSSFIIRHGPTDTQPTNRFNARELFNKPNIFGGVAHNPIFLAVVIITIALQVRPSVRPSIHTTPHHKTRRQQGMVRFVSLTHFPNMAYRW